MHVNIFVKKQDIYVGLDTECHERKLEITVLFYNDAKFDFRLIIEYLANKCYQPNINCIVHSKETFLTFSITNFNCTDIKDFLTHTNT